MLDIILNIGAMVFFALLVCGLAVLLRRTNPKSGEDYPHEPEGMGSFENIMGFRSSGPKGLNPDHPDNP